MPEVPALGRLQQKNHEFEARLDCLARPCLKRKKKKKEKQKDEGNTSNYLKNFYSD
jgi:hypothetical protein